MIWIILLYIIPALFGIGCCIRCLFDKEFSRYFASSYLQVLVVFGHSLIPVLNLWILGVILTDLSSKLDTPIHKEK